MAHGAIAQKRHGAVGDLALGFDLGPPAAPVPQTDTVFLQRFGDDHMLHAVRVEMTVLGQIGDTAVAAGFLVRCARDFDCAAEIGVLFDKGLGRDDRRRQPAFHIAGAAPVNLAVRDFGPEWIKRPAGPDLDHIGVAVEVDTFARPAPFAAGDDVPTGVFLAIAGGTKGADQLRLEPVLAQAGIKVFADQPIVLTRRVKRRDADQILGQRDQIVTLGDNGGRESACHTAMFERAFIYGKRSLQLPRRIRVYFAK